MTFNTVFKVVIILQPFLRSTTHLRKKKTSVCAIVIHRMAKMHRKHLWWNPPFSGMDCNNNIDASVNLSMVSRLCQPWRADCLLLSPEHLLLIFKTTPKVYHFKPPIERNYLSWIPRCWRGNVLARQGAGVWQHKMRENMVARHIASAQKRREKTFRNIFRVFRS